MLTQKQHEMLDNAPDRFAPITELIGWATNYDLGKGPLPVFLDLIGWSSETYGEPLSDLRTVHESLGYFELGQLAAALDFYSDCPTDVQEFLEALFNAEDEEEVSA